MVAIKDGTIMRVAIDIDGTISRYPELFRKMTELWVSKGWFVAVLTGAGNISHEERETQLETYGMKQHRHYHDLAIADNGHLAGAEYVNMAIEYKVDYCRDEFIDLFIDDSPTFCREVATRAPGCMVLKVYELDNDK